jgi:hypothetical protein
MQIDQTELIWLDEHHEVSLDELIELSGLSQKELRHLVEIGALTPNKPAEDNVTTNDLRFSSQCIVSIRTLSRLKHDFELEQNALGLMLVFLERIRNLELQLSAFNPTKQ